jgi:hypothetical protein
VRVDGDLDLEDGPVHCVPADPRQAAAIVGLHRNALVSPRRLARRTNAGQQGGF